MVFVRARAYVHMRCIHGVMSGSLCASGDWSDIYRQREGSTNRRELGSFTYKVIWGCFELKVRKNQNALN